jgi:hypothetical protein
MSFIVSLKSPLNRGPYIAELQLLSDCQPESDKFEGLLLKYFDDFGLLHCYFDSSRAFLDKITDVPHFLSQILARIEQLEDVKSKHLMLVNLWKIKLHFGIESSDRKDSISDLLRLFDESFEFGTIYAILFLVV